MDVGPMNVVNKTLRNLKSKKKNQKPNKIAQSNIKLTEAQKSDQITIV